MNKETKILEFGKLEIGKKFYLSKPETVAVVSFYTKVNSQKDQNGSWYNAKSAFGAPTFVQYDKRVWVVSE